MKKTLLLSLIFLLPFLGTFAQKSTTQDTLGVWHYTTINHVSFPINVSFQRLSLVGDTLINGELYDRIIAESKENLVNSSGHTIEYVRIDDEHEKLLWYNREQNIVTTLYNFAANEGDSWEIAVDNCSFVVTVDSVSIKVFNGDEYRVLHISDENNYFTGDVIEYVGNTRSFFPRDIYQICKYGASPDGQAITNLRCFDNEETLINFENVSCDTTYTSVGIKQEEANQKNIVNIYPNPANNYINIDFENEEYSKNTTISIFDIKGIKIYSSDISNKSSIDVSFLKQGAYFVKINSGNKSPVFKKLFISGN